MKEFKGTNGAKIVINEAPMRDVKRLRQVIAKELMKQNIDIGNPRSIQELIGTVNNHISTYLNIIKNVLLGLEVSEEFNSIMWQCMKICTYDDKTITEQLFDDIPEARIDYDLIQKEVIQVNLAPFMKPLLGMFATLNEETTNNPQ